MLAGGGAGDSFLVPMVEDETDDGDVSVSRRLVGGLAGKEGRRVGSCKVPSKFTLCSFAISRN